MSDHGGQLIGGSALGANALGSRMSILEVTDSEDEIAKFPWKGS